MTLPHPGRGGRLTGISSMATRDLLGDLAVLAASAGLPAVEVESVGGVEAARRVAAGETLDLVFLAADAIELLGRAGHVAQASVRPLVVSQVAVGVPAGAGDPPSALPAAGEAFADAAGVREALRRASAIGYSTGPSGAALLDQIGAWGLSDELADRLVQAPPGVAVAQLLATGRADLGFQQVAEMVGRPGIRILGVLPSECAIDTVFSGAVATTSSDPLRAADVLEFFASDAATSVKTHRAFGTP
jgi:molybdate transport system substrate-binding protein